MKNFFKNLWEGIKTQLWRFLVSTWYVWIAAILGIVAGFIWNGNIGVLTFFGGVLSVIAYIWLRQIWWFVWGSERGDYPGREGWFKKIILLIFPKLRK
jgi:hypothetical protein